MLQTNHQLLKGKRILFVFCSLQLGGAERQGLHLARYFKNLGCDVRVWSNFERYGLVADKCDVLNIPWSIHRFRWPCRKSSLIRDAIRLIFALYKEKPDVILAYTTWPNVGCGLTWRWSPAKVFIWGQRNINDLHGDIVERLAFRLASSAICNAEHEITYLQNIMANTSTPISIIHNGINLSPSIKTRNDWRSDLDIDKAAVVATMIANFRAQKNHSTLLHAWNKFLGGYGKTQPLPRLLLAGLHQETYQRINQMIRELKLNDTVTILGQVADITGLINASDIGVLISNHEGLSNSILEYMAGGLPVIATDLPGNREALGIYPGQLLCKKGDVDHLVQCFQALVFDEELRHKIGTRNRDRAKSNFSIEKMCKSTLDLICDLLNVPAK